MAEVLHIKTSARKQVVDLTDRIEAVIRKAKMQEGLCALFVTHTTAALTTGEIGEGTEEDFLQVVEQMIPREMLYVADEVFFSGTAAEVTPVRSVDKVPVGAGRRGPITARVMEEFFSIAEGRILDRHGWLTHVHRGASAPKVAVQ